MTVQTRAAVFREPGAPPSIENVRLVGPGPDEVVVKVAATGICHTDLAMSEGELWPLHPVVLGHETAGAVVATGQQVGNLSTGSRVLVMDGHCGRCSECKRGHPVLCTGLDQAERTRHIVDLDGRPVRQSAGGFADHLVMPAHSLVEIPDDVPDEVAAVASCAGVTGYGAIVNVARLSPGDSVAIVGCGGVGLAAIMTASALGAEVVAIDPDRIRRDNARRLGASEVYGPDEAELAARHPRGFDVVVECAGRPDAMESAIRMTALGGCAVITGAPGHDTRLSIEVLPLVLRQTRILGCLRGDIHPASDLRAMFELYRVGRLPLDELISDRVALADLPAYLRSGRRPALRTIVHPA